MINTIRKKDREITDIDDIENITGKKSGY